jgi:23S rRNA pseudouridine955/2504/2580 synthase
MSDDLGGVRTVPVGPDDTDQRLDRWFKRHYPDLTHGCLEKLLRTGQIRVDGKRAKASLRVAAGQQVRVPPLAEAASKPRPAGEEPHRPAIGARDAAALRAAVLYRDDWVIAIDKPAGLAVQGGTGQTRHVDAMLDVLRSPGAERPRLVHRLDRDTSGVLLLARSVIAARRLTASFREKDAESGARKLYWALVAGVPERPRGRIDVPLAKLPSARGEKVGAADDQGKDAVTVYRTVASTRLGGSRQRVSWLLLMPLTGRTHQLRAHCVALGVPILGDGKYGGKRAFPALNRSHDGALSKRLMLHAREIAVPHPEDGTTLRISAPLPDDMAEAWAALGFDPRHGDTAVNDLLVYAEGLPIATDKSRPAKLHPDKPRKAKSHPNKPRPNKPPRAKSRPATGRPAKGRKRT